MDLFGTIIIPLLTFFLGFLLNYYLVKKQERTKLLEAEILQLLASLREWYNEIHGLITTSRGLSQDEFLLKVDDYVTSRNWLPKVLYSLTILKGYKQATPLVLETEKFLEFLTNYGTAKRAVLDRWWASPFRTSMVHDIDPRFQVWERTLPIYQLYKSSVREIDLIVCKGSFTDTDLVIPNKEFLEFYKLAQQLQKISIIGGQIVSPIQKRLPPPPK